MIILSSSCSSQLKNQIPPQSENFVKTKFENNVELWGRTQIFKTKEEALSYALDRRLVIQRYQQLQLEPYFGTTALKDCASNIDTSGEIISIDNGKFFFLKLLANENYSIGDCLKQNNVQEAYYEFYICDDGNLIELRHYQPYNLQPPKLKTLRCRLP